MSIFDFGIDFASTKDNQITDNHLLEFSFDNEENNCIENIFGKRIG